jgi:glycosyltransferase involved in cell wall biosynthesis
MSTDSRLDAALFIAGWWPSKANVHDGIFVREHALAVQSKKQVVVIHLTVVKMPWQWFQVKWREEVDNGIVVIHGEIRTPIRRGGLHDRLVRYAYRKALRRLKSRFRLGFMHIHVRTPITENAPVVGAEFGLVSLVTEHSSFYHVWIDHLPTGERETTEERIKKWFAQPSIQAVLPVSNDLGNVLRNRYDVSPRKVHVVPNVASPDFHPRSLVDTEHFRIVLAARWSEPKDPTLFIEALRRLPATTLVKLRVDWIGDGVLYQPARDLCKDLIDQGVMHFPGRMTKPELASTLGQAHLLVHPTKAENLPCIIIESLCSGTPVLSMAVNGIPELVNGSNGVLCPPRNIEAFATALQEIVNNYQFDRLMIASDAQRRFSQEHVAARLLEIYAEVAG